MTNDIIKAIENNTLIEDEVYLDYIGKRLEEEELEKLKYGLSIKKETYEYINIVSKKKLKH
jgi:hypothetical protein